MEGLRIIKIVKQIKFEIVRGELEARKCFQRESFTKYFRLIFDFLYEIAHYGKNLIPAYEEFLCSINKTFILARRLNNRI